MKDKLKIIVGQTESNFASESPENQYKGFQSEEQLENQLIKTLTYQGYEYTSDIKDHEDMKSNLKLQMEKLNKDKLKNGDFTESEWERFFETVVCNKKEGIIEKTEKLRTQISFQLDDGSIKNFILLSPNGAENTFQVANQISTTGNSKNRYDVTILVNGLPLVHIELKKRGIPLKEAFNQVNRYKRDSFWAESGLFNYVQIFVISNGTITKYYSNTTKELSRLNQEGKIISVKKTFAYEFTSCWTDKTNKKIDNLIDFAKTFLEYRHLSKMLYDYCILDVNKTLLVLRPYQVHAVEAIKTHVKTHSDKPGNIDAGGYIWHTTGSGKTLTSFCTATLLSQDNELNIDKVLFVVDRKDLDYQTIKEFNRFAEGSVNATTSTKNLSKQLSDNNTKIIVTTIQKLERYINKNQQNKIKNKKVVLIFDECHRSQFGKFHKSIINFFSKYHIFGFTGTPIFANNSDKSNVISKNSQAHVATTKMVFGKQLHTYNIVDAINDNNALPFRIDYLKTFKENELAKKYFTKEVFDSDERIMNNVDYILENHDIKTKNRHYNSILAASSTETACKYYSLINQLQNDKQNKNSGNYDPSFKPLKVAMIFSHNSSNQEQIGLEGDINSISEEELENIPKLSQNNTEVLSKAITDYNQLFKTNYSLENNFDEYYQNLSARMKSHKNTKGEDVSFDIDLLIVVNMFLTGFDAVTLNTLYVDKQLKYHGLIQAFSRTNRILNAEKSYGQIVCFRDLEQEVEEAIALFGGNEASNIILLKSYQTYIEDYQKILSELKPLQEINMIQSEQEKEEFIVNWSKLLKTNNILTSFEEFSKEKNKLSLGEIQDYNSYYLELKDEIHSNKGETDNNALQELEFETELVKSIEINIDYILAMIQKYSDSYENNIKTELETSLKKALKSSPTFKNNQELILNFLKHIDENQNTPDFKIDQEFLNYCKECARNDLHLIIKENELKEKETILIVNSCLKNKEIDISGNTIIKLYTKSPSFGKNRQLAKQKLYEILSYFNEKYSIFIDSTH